ncbi:MAG: cobalamin-binding protein [Chlorobi bacterium]|nr:cobalamin-binding protein [Chlorobiota bacterium]
MQSFSRPDGRNPVLLLVLAMLLIAGCSPAESPKKENLDGAPRIVSLAPSVTEMIFAIGAGKQLAGRTSACDWPMEAARVPVAGAFGRPSLEMIASIHPDIVIDVDLEDERNSAKITAMGMRIEHISCKTPDDIPEALRKLGRLTGRAKKADSLAAVIEQGLSDFRKKNLKRTQKPRVYLEIWDDPCWTGGLDSYTSALIGYAGGHNIGDAVGKEYFEVSEEWVIQQNPDVIACMYMSKRYPAADGVMQRNGWQHIAAVRHKKVFDGFDNSLFLRPGPRVLEGISRMEKLLEKK